MTKTEAAYIAGIIDGEGSIMLAKSKSKLSPVGFQWKPLVELVMCDRLTITWVAERADRGRIGHRRLPSGRVAHKLIWHNSHAANLLRKLLPYLIGKREQAELLIHFEDHITPKRGRRYEPEHVPLCDGIREQLQALKKVGVTRC